MVDTDDTRRTTDDGRRTTPRVWHKLPTGELKNNININKAKSVLMVAPLEIIFIEFLKMVRIANNLNYLNNYNNKILILI